MVSSHKVRILGIKTPHGLFDWSFETRFSQVGLKPYDPPTSTSHVLGFQLCATMPGSCFIFNRVVHTDFKVVFSNILL
jgi:hypothetical protein